MIPLTDDDWMKIQQRLLRPICRKVCGHHYALPDIEANILSILWERSRKLQHEKNLKGWIVKTIYREAVKQLTTCAKKKLPQSDDVTLTEICSKGQSVLDILCDEETFTRVAQQKHEMDRIRLSALERGLPAAKIKQILRCCKSIINKTLE